MRFRKRPEPRLETYWKPWFAWHPVRIEDFDGIVWLEWVWRHVDHYAATPCDIVTCTRYRSDVHWAAANLEFRDR
jgi:hypothetical protein